MILYMMFNLTIMEIILQHVVQIRKLKFGIKCMLVMDQDKEKDLVKSCPMTTISNGSASKYWQVVKVIPVLYGALLGLILSLDLIQFWLPVGTTNRSSSGARLNSQNNNSKIKDNNQKSCKREQISS